jgi:hypothetical protein
MPGHIPSSSLSKAQGRVWLIAACVPASALMNQAGGGALGTQSSGLKPLRVTFAGGGGNR